MTADALALTPVPGAPGGPMGDGGPWSAIPVTAPSAVAPTLPDIVPDPLTGPVPHTERAVIGDKLRRPAMWCELTPCISRHSDPEALGEADARARAVDAGWRADAFGRLVCPQCQQRDTRFRGTRPLVRWRRDTALTMTALMVAAFQELLRPTVWGEEETAVMPVLAASVLAQPPAAEGPARRFSRRR
jgi:hypothetical protein